MAQTELYPPLHEDTDRLFHQLTLDPTYDERPELALAENSTAPISLLLLRFRTTVSERMSFAAKLGPCCVLLMKTHVPQYFKRQRSDCRDN